MEKTILGKLEWTSTVPTPFVFLVRFIKAASESMVPPDQRALEMMAHFLSELGMMHYATLRYFGCWISSICSKERDSC